MKIFIVEDDFMVSELLVRQLSRHSYDVELIKDLRRVDDEVRESMPNLILLDINLPFYDGFFWCRKIRLFTKAPILFISARNSGMDQVTALENGGDDYICKPFSTDVLLAKVQAILRRTYGEYAELQDKSMTNNYKTIAAGELQLDLRRATVQYRSNSETLSKTELELLRCLLEADGAVVQRQELLEAIWDDADFVDDNTLTVNVTRLRRKLTRLGLHNVILTVRGLGYRYDTGSIQEQTTVDMTGIDEGSSEQWTGGPR